MITFNQIPVDLRVPGQYLEIDASKAIGGLPATPSKILVIGQRLATGAVPALTPTQIVTAAQAAQAFGRGSMLAQQLAALKAANDATECWAIALDDVAGGTSASGAIVVNALNGAAGTLPLYIDGVAVPVAIAAGATATQVVNAAVAAVNALPDLPVSASGAGGAVPGSTITFTARHKGASGNDLDIRVGYQQGDALPAGVSVQVAQMAGGAGNPDISAVWATIGDARYATVLLPFVDAATLTSVETELASRWSAARMIETMAYGAYRGSLGAAAALGTSRNSAFVSILGMRGALASPWRVAAAYGGVIAFNASIDPARDFATLPLPGIPAPAQTDRWIKQERELLLHDGISTYGVEPGGVVAIERAITTYQTSPLGLPDVAFLDVTTPLTVGYLRYAVRRRIATKFPRMKLADDNAGFGVGQPVVTPKIIRAELIALFRELEEAGLVEDVDQFKADLRVERDAVDRNRVNAIIPPNIVNQFRVFAGAVQFLL